MLLNTIRAVCIVGTISILPSNIDSNFPLKLKSNESAMEISDEKPMNDAMFLILNMQNKAVLPRNFRMSVDHFTYKPKKTPKTDGLVELKASASGQFSEESFKKMRETIPSKKIIIVDLRQESHGFVNGIAVSRYAERNLGNLGKPLQTIQKDENDWLNQMLEQGFFILHDDDANPITVRIETVSTEEALAKSLNLLYKRLPITDHRPFLDNDIDQFVDLLKNLPNDYWVHFHCSAGKGRATTAIVMYDMMRNAGNVSYADIILRQNLIGGRDMSTLPETDNWKYSYHKDRLTLLQKFYQYCAENRDQNFAQTWSSWSKSQK